MIHNFMLPPWRSGRFSDLDREDPGSKPGEGKHYSSIVFPFGKTVCFFQEIDSDFLFKYLNEV